MVGTLSDNVPLLADDKELMMRIFLDNVVAECYWQDGRVAMTVPSKTVASAALKYVLSSRDDQQCTTLFFPS